MRVNKNCPKTLRDKKPIIVIKINEKHSANSGDSSVPNKWLNGFVRNVNVM